MFLRRSSTLAVILRNSLITLMLSAGLVPAAFADEAFYGLRAQGAAVKTPEAPAPSTVRGAASAGYLSQAELQMADFPAPPAAGSAEDLADLAAVRQWQKDRTAEQCTGAMAQSDESFISFFSGVNPFPDPLPAEAGALFRRVGAHAGDAARNIKKDYKRVRPFVRSPELEPCLGRVQGFSYPSGHAAVARAYGRILSGLLPRQGAIFMRAADQAALNRVIGGVHYPSDVEAGKKLGDLLFRKLQQNPAFAADLSALSKYLRH